MNNSGGNAGIVLTFCVWITLRSHNYVDIDALTMFNYKNASKFHEKKISHKYNYHIKDDWN